MEMTFSQILESLLFVGAIGGVWMRVQTKLKELDIRMKVLENQLTTESKQIDKVLQKIEQISESILELKIDLNNKQNKD